jgi:EEF1A lysine methyltransferase 1
MPLALLAQAAQLLLKPGGLVLASTIAENADFMKELLNVTPQVFKPSIPNLVYQYRLYTNYESSTLSQLNPEIPEEEP